MENYITNSMDVMAIYYDFIPTIHDSKKVLWVQLWSPPPRSLYGSKVTLQSLDKNLGVPDQKFQVADVIGTRVALVPLLNIPQPSYKDITEFIPKNQWTHNGPSSLWIASDHDKHWGYALKNWENIVQATGHGNWTYGSGRPMARLVW